MSDPVVLNVNRNWHFEIKPLYSLVMIVGIAICSMAAYWQYNKALHFQSTIYSIETFSGQFLHDHTAYLDNQTHDGKVGYAIITPFLTSTSTYLINRGFLAYKNRNQLPHVAKTSGVITISGYIKPIQKPLLLNETRKDPLSKRIQFIDYKKIGESLNTDISPYVIVQHGGEGSLDIKPLPEPYLSHHRHQAYALQWMILGVCGVLILIVASVKRGASDE